MTRLSHRRSRPGFAWLRVLILLIVLALLGAIGAGVYAYAKPAVTTTTVIDGPVIQAVYATGTIEPRREYPIRSNVAGIIDVVQVDKGDAVKKDQTLAIVDDGALKYAVDKAAAELAEKQGQIQPSLAEFDARIAAMQSRLEIAQREEKRLNDLVASNSTTTVDRDRATDVVKTLWAELESLKSQRALRELELKRQVAVAESALATAQWNFDQETMKAPIDGTVLDRPKSKGTRVAVNDVIMRVADVTPTNLVMRASVDEEDITSVKIGQRVIVTLYAFHDGHFEGKVSQIYPEADPTRRTFEVDVELGDDARRQGLQSGMTGEIAFVVAQKDSTRIIPSQAVQDGGAVYVIENGRVKRLEPKIGIRAVERTEILDGIPSGATVIISPATPALIGKPTRETKMDPKEAAGLNKPKDHGNFKGFGS
ncbi:MAG: efflux RND transporter periplasmic adaptor subunit [Tepidisphaeraceae bacterium]